MTLRGGDLRKKKPSPSSSFHGKETGHVELKIHSDEESFI
jgi:hypothetical protein